MVDQEKFLPILTDVARRSFRDVADGDYISARMCFIHRLYPQYIWHSQQCIEKYLKGILLFNRQSAKNLGHKLLKAHKRILDSLSLLGVNLSEDTLTYLRYLDTWGENRYFEKPHFMTPNNNIDKLDRAVWEIRRFCQHFELRKNKATRVSKLKLKTVRDATFNSDLSTVVNGKLKEIIESEKHIHHGFLITCNKYFGGYEGDIPSPLHAINPAQTLYSEYFDELNKYIHFPQEVVKAFENINQKTVTE